MGNRKSGTSLNNFGSKIFEPEKLTFRPLSGGRFTCNQTGEKTKNCDAYRRSHGTKRRNVEQKAPRISIAKMRWNRVWDCPSCHQANFSGVVYQKNSCTGCGRKVWLDQI